VKPNSPFAQTFDQLPEQLPLYPLENALPPGGELPLELSEPAALALFLKALNKNKTGVRSRFRLT
jgi:Lon protease-like protein